MATEAIVSTILQQLTSIIGREAEQEVRLVVGVEKEIEKLKNNFQGIQVVLVDAEQRQVKELAVRAWLDQLKDISYKIDDVLDEWNTAILRLQIEGVQNARITKSKVCFMFSSPCFCFRQVSLRHDIGVKIKEINEKLDSIAIAKDRYNLHMINSVEEPQRLITTSFIEVSEISGLDDEKNNLINKLLNEQKETSIPIISIVGMGGIGKTTLAQLAYNDIKIISKFDKRIWVCVSDPFDEGRIARAIIEGLRGEATSLAEFQSLLECIREIIVEKRLLLILDDVWTEDYEKWGPLYNSLNNGFCQGSKIVVTTRKKNVARMMKSVEVIDIKQLSEDKSWLLFKQFAFCDRSLEESKRLENIGREIVGKCKGLPLAIKTMGSLLRFKETQDQWQRILDSELWKLEEVEKGLFPPLLFSYYNLSSMVKQCFSYCAIFPKDYEMGKYELIKLWMAQGYLGSNQEEELEIIGEEALNTLAMHSLFQEFKKDGTGSIYECKMHDIVHDFAQFLVRDECLTKEIIRSEHQSLSVSFENARHSTFLVNSSLDVNFHSVDKLRSLLIKPSSHWYIELGGFSKLFKQSTCLRALKLIKTAGTNTIAREIGKLIHLRYLDMSDLAIRELPETLCCLYNLQTLDVRMCYNLRKLPEGMGKLTNLRHLINMGTSKLVYMPKAIERLVCLRTLSEFAVGVDAHGKGMATLECLKNLNKLRGSLQLSGLGNVADEAEAKNAQLMNRKNLVALELRYSRSSGMTSGEECGKDSAILEALQPPPTLEVLNINGCSSPTLSPHWMVSLTQLKSLTLEYCDKCDYLPPLGKLPLLQTLWIQRLASVKRVSNEFVGMETSSSSSSPSVVAFPKLETLHFLLMFDWEDWEYHTTGDITIMPSLSFLIIDNSPKLKSLPDYLLHATSLKQLVISGCPILEAQYRSFVSKFNKELMDAMENSP